MKHVVNDQQQHLQQKNRNELEMYRWNRGEQKRMNNQK